MKKKKLENIELKPDFLDELDLMYFKFNGEEVDFETYKIVAKGAFLNRKEDLESLLELDMFTPLEKKVIKYLLDIWDSIYDISIDDIYHAKFLKSCNSCSTILNTFRSKEILEYFKNKFSVLSLPIVRLPIVRLEKEFFQLEKKETYNIYFLSNATLYPNCSDVSPIKESRGILILEILYQDLTKKEVSSQKRYIKLSEKQATNFLKYFTSDDYQVDSKKSMETGINLFLQDLFPKIDLTLTSQIYFQDTKIFTKLGENSYSNLTFLDLLKTPLSYMYEVL